MGDNFIKYSDLIKPDDSIDKLIGKLEELRNSYKQTASEIASAAKQLSNDIKSANSATAAGRAVIESAASTSSNYAQTMESLKEAMDRVSKSLDNMKSRQSSTTSVSSSQKMAIDELTKRYNDAAKSIKNLSSFYDSLTASQKNNPLVGGATLAKINESVTAIKELDGQMKTYMQTLVASGQAEELLYGQLGQGVRAMEEVRAKTSAVNAELKANAQLAAEADIACAKEAQARVKLSQAQSQSNEALQKINLTTREANLAAKYKAELDGHIVDMNNLAASSYNQLAAQYGLNKIALNKLTDEERKNTQEGQELEKQTYEIYQQMKKLQEATGKNTLSVGDYNRVWDGLRYQTQQVVRELPSLTVSLNQFFLAISNNIPLLTDEIRRFKDEGNSTKDAFKKIMGSIFSWQTALIVGLTLLAKYGKQIGEFVKGLFSAGKASYSFAESLRDINKEMSNIKVGDEIASFQAMRKEWNNLKTDMERAQFLKDRKSNIDALKASVDNVTEAESLFSTNADAFVEAMRIRAKSIAAATVAGQAYQEWVEKSLAAENIQYDKDRGIVKFWDKAKAALTRTSWLLNITGNTLSGADIQTARLEKLQNQAESAWNKATKVQEDFQSKYEEQYKDLLESIGISEFTKDPDTIRAPKKEKDLQSYIDNMVLRLKKAHNDILQAIDPDSYAQRLQKINDDYDEKTKELQNIIDKNNRELNNKNKKYTAQQREQLKAANEEAIKALADLSKKSSYELNRLNTEHRIELLEAQKATSNLWIEIEGETSEHGFQERLANLRRNMMIEIEENNLLTEEEKQEEYLIRQKWNQKIAELQVEHAKSVRESRLRVKQDQAAGSPSDLGTQLSSSLYSADVSYSNEMDAFVNLPVEQQTQEAWDAIIAKHTAIRKKIYADYFQEVLSQQQSADKAEFDSKRHSEYEITKFTLAQEMERLKLMKKLYDEGVLDLNSDQLRELLANIERVGREQKESISVVLKDSVGGTILSALGFDDDSMSQFESYKDEIIDQLGEILEAEVEMAEKEVELQQERVNAAQSAYDAEVQARANGYANSVVSAKRELQLQQSTLRQKQAQLERANRAQRALESAQQASSLVTATAQLWAATASIPIVGPVLAAVATAAMFAAFIASKVKAAQVAQTYGEGGLEFLEGGSHASGHDINLGVNNSKGKQMRAEGGEAMAIINKKNTKRYRSILPDVIDSLNRGTFEQKYASPNRELVGLSIGNVERGSDLSTLEEGVGTLIKQNKERIVELGDRTVIYRGSVRKIVKHA